MFGDIVELRDSRRKHFFTVDNEIFDMNLSVYALAVYFYLCRCAGDKSYAFPSLSNLHQILSISKNRILKSLKELEEKNIIRRERRKGEKGNYQNTVYVLLDKSVWKRRGCLSDEQGVVCQTNKGCSSGGQGVVHEVNKGCSSGEHKEKINKKTQLEEKTEREYISSPTEEENSLPKKIKEEELRKAGNGEKFDDGKEFEPDSANNLHRKVSNGHILKKPISPHARQIIETFKHFFLQKFGIPPTITSKSIRELEAILSQLSLTERAAFVEKAKKAVKRYLSSKELFVEKVGYSFQTFVTTMQKYMMEDRKLNNSQQELHNTKPSNPEHGVVEEYEF